MKYKIEKNTVQETLIIPLYARKVCSELYPNLYRDETAVRLIDEIDYDFSEAEKNSRGLMQRFGSLEVAMRQNDLPRKKTTASRLGLSAARGRRTGSWWRGRMSRWWTRGTLPSCRESSNPASVRGLPVSRACSRGFSNAGSAGSR